MEKYTADDLKTACQFAFLNDCTKCLLHHLPDYPVGRCPVEDGACYLWVALPGDTDA